MNLGDIVQGLVAGVGIDLSPDGKTAYYVEWSIGELSRVEVETGKVTTVHTGLSFPEDVEVDWDEGQIFVSERNGAIKKILSEKNYEIIANVDGAPQQLKLVKLGSKRYLYMVCYDSGTLIRLDIVLKTTKTIATGLGHPVGLVLDSANKYAYVTEQDSGSLTRVRLLTGIKTLLYSGLVNPFFLAWNKTAKGIFCIQRDPSNSLVLLELGTSVVLKTIAAGLAWRPSGVAPNADNTLIYICADQKLEVISFDGLPQIKPDPLPFDIHSIEFNYSKSDAIPLKDHITGNPISVPEWVNNIRNEPAAYVAGTLPHIKVIFHKLPGYVNGTYAVGAIGNLGGVRRKYIAPVFQPSGLSDPVDFELMWPLPPYVGKHGVLLEWNARLTLVPSVPVSIGSTDHNIYLTVDKPTGPWQQEAPWVAALELACQWAAGATTVDAAAELVTRGVNGCPLLRYTPATMFGWSSYLLSSFLSMLNSGNIFVLNCTDCADAVTTFSNLLGCDLWEGRFFNMKTRKFLTLGGNPSVGSDWVSWNWSYHEICWLHSIGPNEFVYDGCLQLDIDNNYADNVQIPYLAVKMKFADYLYRLVESGSCTLENVPRRRPVM